MRNALPVILALVLTPLALACSAPAVDSTTESYRGTIGNECASRHDCSANQRCIERKCELEANGCLANEDCGSLRCEAGFCALPAPAALSEAPQSAAGAVRAGRDGLVDREGGLVLSIGGNVIVEDQQVLWSEWALQGWRAETDNPANWAPLEGASMPERFVWKHEPTGARLVALVRPLRSQELGARQASLKTHVDRIVDALREGVSFVDAVALVGKKADVSTPLERTFYKVDTLEQLQSVRFEALRHQHAEGGERLRFEVARLEFGGKHYLAVVGLVTPINDYTSLLDELSDFEEFIRFAGIDAKVEPGVE